MITSSQLEVLRNKWNVLQKDGISHEMESEELYNLAIDLEEIDTFVAGCYFSLIKGAEVKKLTLQNCLQGAKEIQAKLQNLKIPDELETLQTLKDYTHHSIDLTTYMLSLL